MSDTRVTTVLILAEPTIGHKWEEMLRGPETRVWLGRAAIPDGERPEIILTNSARTAGRSAGRGGRDPGGW